MKHSPSPKDYYIDATNEERLVVESSEWKCYLFGTGVNGIVLTPAKGQVPNWFWRWMQYLAFGNKWVKNK